MLHSGRRVPLIRNLSDQTWRLGFGAFGAFGVTHFVYFNYWNDKVSDRRFQIELSKHCKTRQNNKEWMQLRSLYWNLQALDGLNNNNKIPNDAWLYWFLVPALGHLVLGGWRHGRALISHARKTAAIKFGQRPLVAKASKIDPLGHRSLSKIWSPQLSQKISLDNGRYLDFKCAFLYFCVGVVLNWVDYTETDRNTRQFLKDAFPQYTDEVVESLTLNHEATCRLIATIINVNPHLFSKKDMQTVANYVEKETGKETFWDDAHSWIHYSPVITMEYLFRDQTSLYLLPCIRTPVSFFQTPLQLARRQFCPAVESSVKRNANCCPRQAISDWFEITGRGVWYVHRDDDDLRYRYYLQLLTHRQKPKSLGPNLVTH